MTPAEQAEQNDPAPVGLLCRRVEEASINAWPAMQQVLLDGWLIRLSRGFTKRANCVVPLYPGGQQPLADKVRFCENLFARERLKCIFRLTSIGDHEPLDAFLADRGYRAQDPTEVLTLSLAAARGDTPMPPPKTLTASPRPCFLTTARWLDVYAELTGMPDSARRLHGAILHGIPLNCAYAAIGSPEQPLACGMAVLERDLVGLFDVVTHAHARRAGHGTALVTSLLKWGFEHGSQRAYLQMVSDNDPARRLYTRLGFEPLYRYWYRILG